MKNMENTAAFMEKYRLLLEQGETLTLPVLGGSMAPFLVDRRDAVWLTAPARPPRVGDIVLYQRKNGAYILHRICKKQGGVYTLVGDAQTIVEPGIEENQIFAVAVRARRKGKTQKPGCFWWEFFARIWVRVIPLRPALLRAYSLLTKPFRRSL